MNTLTITNRIRYAIRNAVGPLVCSTIGHRREVVDLDGQKFTLCTRCGEN